MEIELDLKSMSDTEILKMLQRGINTDSARDLMLDELFDRAQDREEFESLVNTSIEDARSSAKFSSLKVLILAHKSAVNSGQKSKARMLQTEINKREKAQPSDPKCTCKKMKLAGIGEVINATSCPIHR